MSGQDQINKTDIDWIKETLVRIETQTKETNGRVKALELFKARVTGMYVVGGAVAMVAIGFGVDLLLRHLIG